jgi:hypothetical protein
MFEYVPEFNGLTDVVYSDFRNEEERKFLTSLYNYAPEWKKYGLDDDNFIMFYEGETVTVAFDIIDENENLVLRSLRVDFDHTNLLLGEDITMQYVCKLDVNDPKVKKYRKSEYSTVELSEIAANWIVTEAARKIELREWVTSSYRHRVWVLADTDNPISMSDSKNELGRKNLGHPTRTKIAYPPDTIN